MKSIKTFTNLLRNIVRSFGMSFRYAPWLTSVFSIAAISLGLVTILQNNILGNIVNEIVQIGQKGAAPSSSHAALILVLGYAGTMLGYSVISEIKLLADKIWTINMDHYLSNMFLEKRAKIDLAHYENPEFQNLLQKAFTQDIWPIYTLVEFTVLNIANLVVIAVTSTITTSISWHVYALVLLSAVPMFIVEIRYGSRVWGMWSENSSNFRIYTALRDHISNLDKIAETKALQISGKLLDITEGIMDDFRKRRIDADGARLKWVIGASIVSSAGFGYALYYIVSAVLQGSIAAGTMVFLVASLTQLVGAIGDVLQKTAEQYKRNLYVNDLFKVLDTEPFVAKAKNPVRLDLTAPARITLENVSFKYQGREDWILRNVSFEIEPGEKVALVGENGAGKSTLVKLLMRIYDPTEGRILVNGHDLKDVDHEEWLSAISVLLQKYSMFEFNVGEAISAGRTFEKDQSDELVQETARLSGAHEFISEYKKGYGQQLGKEFDEGMEPSQGQEQKIALARTLYRLEDGFMVILDEPTAAIDPVAETEIFEKMEKATEGKSLVLITHRFNTVKGVDKIVVIEHGQVQEIGNHASLMLKKGRYATMFESQAKGFVEGMKI